MTFSPVEALAAAHLRIARPTDRLDEVVQFYQSVLGFSELGRFVGHNGIDGVMLGHPGLGYHLEFTHTHGHHVGNAPTPDNLLVFYIADQTRWRSVIDHIECHGVSAVESFNPYWDRLGKTFEDPDGYRIVIQNAEWGG